MKNSGAGDGHYGEMRRGEIVRSKGVKKEALAAALCQKSGLVEAGFDLNLVL